MLYRYLILSLSPYKIMPFIAFPFSKLRRNEISRLIQMQHWYGLSKLFHIHEGHYLNIDTGTFNHMQCHSIFEGDTFQLCRLAMIICYLNEEMKGWSLIFTPLKWNRVADKVLKKFAFSIAQFQNATADWWKIETSYRIMTHFISLSTI